MYGHAQNWNAQPRVSYASVGYQRVPMQEFVDQSYVEIQKPPESFTAPNYTNEVSKMTEPVEVETGSVQEKEGSIIKLRKSIYSAGAVKCIYIVSVIATFIVQVFILFVNLTENDLTFFSSIGYTGDNYEYDVFKRALGRFICFLLILLKCQEDLQNAIDIMFTSNGAHCIICAILQLLVALSLPVGFVMTISINTNVTQDIIKTGLLKIFIDMDSSVYNLVLISNESSDEVQELKMQCDSKWDKTRKWFISIVVPVYMMAFFLVVWYAALEEYPFAFAFMVSTLAMYATPYFDQKKGYARKVTNLLEEQVELAKRALPLPKVLS